MKASVQALINGFKEAATQAIEQMIDEMGVGNILDKLYTLPDAIKGTEEDLLAARRGMEAAKGEMELAKQIVVAVVAEEKDHMTGKARFSNAETRSAEVTRRLSFNEDYLEAKKEFQAAEDAVSSAQFELTKLHNEFSAAKIVGQILAAKMNLLAGL